MKGLRDDERNLDLLVLKVAWPGSHIPIRSPVTPVGITRTAHDESVN